MTGLIDEIIVSVHSNLNKDNVLQALKIYCECFNKGDEQQFVKKLWKKCLEPEVYRCVMEYYEFTEQEEQELKDEMHKLYKNTKTIEDIMKNINIIMEMCMEDIEDKNYLLNKFIPKCANYFEYLLNKLKSDDRFTHEVCFNRFIKPYIGVFKFQNITPCVLELKHCMYCNNNSTMCFKHKNQMFLIICCDNCSSMIPNDYINL